MFSVNGNDYVLVHKARQRELEADAQNKRLANAFVQTRVVAPFRQKVGVMLINLGKKIAQEPKLDARLVLLARHQ